MYPLAVAARKSGLIPAALATEPASTQQARQKKADSVLQYIRSQPQHERLVAEAELLGDELIRVAILWHELWYEALEEASRFWWGDRNFKGTPPFFP